MRFCKVRIKLNSPTILPERRVERGYKGCLDYIPSTTLRGSILTSLYLSGYVEIDKVKNLARSFDVLVSNAYPVVENRESQPSHPFMYECKVPHGKKHEKVNFINEVVDELRFHRKTPFKFECSRGHSALSYVHPKPVMLLDCKEEMFKVASVRAQSTISTAVSKRRASSQSGMLYEYDFMVEGQSFWSYIGISDELSKYIEEGLELRIGRGVSRGFGSSYIENVEWLSLNEVVEKIKSEVDLHKAVLFYAQSPLLGFDGFANYTPYPKNIELNSVLKMCEFNVYEAGSIIISEVYAKTRTLHGGWDMDMNVRRPVFTNITSEGGIVVGYVNAKQDTIMALTLLSIVGYPVKVYEYVFTGLNILTPLQIHPISGGKGG